MSNIRKGLILYPAKSLEMLFSKACEYGMRAIIYIAQQSLTGQKVSLKTIAKEIDGPEAFTSKILQQLTKKDILKSFKGSTGGFIMEECKLKKINLLEVVEAIDGTKVLTQCGLGLEVCSETFPCPVHYKFKAVRNELREMLATTSVYDSVVGLEQKKLFLKR